jgi:hypothetical protein
LQQLATRDKDFTSSAGKKPKTACARIWTNPTWTVLISIMEIPVQGKYILLSTDFSASAHYKQNICLETFIVTEFNTILSG